MNTVPFVFVLVVGVLGACSASSPPGAGDAGGRATLRIGDHCRAEHGWRPDAGRADAARSAADLPPIGAGTCGLWPDAPDGYFTARCETNADCPDGARCGRGSHWCVMRCRSNDDCIAPASCHLSAAAAVSYCQVTGGVLARGDRDAGATDDCELPCGFYQTCCNAECFDLANDPAHCGHCDHACDQDAPYCEDGRCVQPSCAASCEDATCCGEACCASAETCCAVYGPDGPVPTCVAHHPGQPCPSGCHDC